MNLMECSYEDEGPKFTPKHSSLITMHLPLLYCPQKVEVSGSGGGGCLILHPLPHLLLNDSLPPYVLHLGCRHEEEGREGSMPATASKEEKCGDWGGELLKPH